MIVQVHSGTLSVCNGATAPLTLYFEFARMLQTPPQVGQFYGDDKLEVPDEDWPVVEQLLIENKMLYKVVGTHDSWQNVCTDEVRDRIRGYAYA